MQRPDARDADDIQHLLSGLNAEPGVRYADLQPVDHVATALRRWPLLSRLRQGLLAQAVRLPAP